MKMFKPAVCSAVLVVALFSTGSLHAQFYSGCGTLIDQIFGGCVELFQPEGSTDVYQLNGIGSPGYVTGDEVYVEGNLIALCPTFCAITACLDTTFIGDCGVPFDECGVLVQGPTCVLLETGGGELYELDNLGGFGVGDGVLVIGTLDSACGAACDADGCVTGNTIEICPTPFLRADANDDGAVDIADAVLILSRLFVPGTDPGTCVATGDANSDQAVDVSDAIYTLSFLFVAGSPAPAAPYPDCGEPDPAGAGCVIFNSCP